MRCMVHMLHFLYSLRYFTQFNANCQISWASGLDMDYFTIEIRLKVPVDFLELLADADI